MRVQRILVLAAALGAGMVSMASNPQALAAQQVERHVLRGSDIAVYNLAGEMRVEAGTGSEVVVEVERGGRAADRLRIQTGRLNAQETLRVVYPGNQIVYPRLSRMSRSQLRVRDDGTFGGRSPGRQVTVAGSGGGLEAYADLRVHVPAGQRIAVHQGVGKVWVANVNGELRVHGSSASVETEGTRGFLRVDVGSGGVRVSRAEGDVEVDTGSGSVQLEGIRGAKLHVDTGSGSVTGAGLDVADLNVDVGSGRVRLSDVRAGSILVDTGSGSVDLALLAPARSVRIDTGSGGVTLTVPRTMGAELAIDTGSGGIRVDLPVQAMQSSRSRFRGRLGDGSGSIRIDTGSGGVRVQGT